MGNALKRTTSSSQAGTTEKRGDLGRQILTWKRVASTHPILIPDLKGTETWTLWSEMYHLPNDD